MGGGGGPAACMWGEGGGAAACMWVGQLPACWGKAVGELSACDEMGWGKLPACGRKAVGQLPACGGKGAAACMSCALLPAGILRVPLRRGTPTTPHRPQPLSANIVSRSASSLPPPARARSAVFRVKLSATRRRKGLKGAMAAPTRVSSRRWVCWRMTGSGGGGDRRQAVQLRQQPGDAVLQQRCASSLTPSRGSAARRAAPCR